MHEGSIQHSARCRNPAPWTIQTYLETSTWHSPAPSGLPNRKDSVGPSRLPLLGFKLPSPLYMGLGFSPTALRRDDIERVSAMADDLIRKCCIQVRELCSAVLKAAMLWREARLVVIRAALIVLSAAAAGGRFRGKLGRALLTTTGLYQSVLAPDLVTNKVRDLCRWLGRWVTT